jgi:hypothetical protein
MAKDVAGLPEPFGGQAGEQGEAHEPQHPDRAQDPQRPQHRHDHDDQVGEVARDELAPVGARYRLMAYSAAKTAQIR